MPDGKHSIPTQGQDANVNLIFVITAMVIVVAAFFGVLIVVGARVAIAVTLNTIQLSATVCATSLLLSEQGCSTINTIIILIWSTCNDHDSHITCSRCRPCRFQAL